MDITVALGGGGAKGNAHSGVLRVLQREGFHIRALAGTSAGGLWGALYLTGHSPDEIDEIMGAFDPDRIYARDDGDGPALLGTSGLREMLQQKIGQLRFEDLDIPFAVTAVDIETAEAVTIQSGSIYEAVLATIAVPGVFPPHEINGRMLIDGGVMNPVPVSIARRFLPDLPVVAVVLAPPQNPWSTPSVSRLLPSLPYLSTYLAKLRISKALNIYLRSVEIGSALLTDLHLELEKPDVIIRPQVPKIGLLDEVEIDEIVLLGEIAAREALPELRAAVSLQGKIKRRLFGQSYPDRMGKQIHGA